MMPTPCACTNLRRAARAVSGFYDTMLAPTGVGVAQLSLLRSIARLDQCSITALASATGLDRSTLGRNLRVLERAGLVALGSAGDARMRGVTLTDEARDRLAQAEPLWQGAQARIRATLSPGEADVLHAALTRLADLDPATGDTP